MKASRWLAEVKTATGQYFPDSLLHIQIIRETRVKVRIEIGEDVFADLFFREETGRTDYALIVRGKRCYGLDNLGGWHEHPHDAPESHVPTEAPSPGEAFRRLKAVSDMLKR